MANPATLTDSCTLVQLCIKKVAHHMDVLEKQACDLPAALLKDLMPHLNMFYLDRIEKAAHVKGVSASFAWAAKWRDLNRTWRCKLKFMPPGADWKQKCLESFFHKLLLSPRHAHNSLPNINAHEVLSVCAHHVRVLSLPATAQDMCTRLASQQLRPVLSILEKGVLSLRLHDASKLLRYGQADVLFVVHRLLDHGAVTKIVLRRAHSAFVLRWFACRCRGPLDQVHWIGEPHWMPSVTARSSQDQGLGCQEGPSAAKRPHLHVLTDGEACGSLPCYSVHGEHPLGQVLTLDLEVDGLRTVSPVLPSCTGLRALHLYTSQPLWESEVVDLVESLRRLFLSPHCSLRALSVGNVSGRGLLASLLQACPTLRSLSLDINPPGGNSSVCSPNLQFNTKLSLEKLSLKSSEIQMTVESFPDILHHTPELSSLHVSGIRHGHMLLQTLPEFNPLLKKLTLKDVSLAYCHQEIIHLLENSVLEELCLKDCRLLEKCTNKKAFLGQFVEAAKGLSSLDVLSLSQNRLATSVIEIADLFSGECSSKITKLDLSSNFILPADLLEFSQRIRACRPAQRLTLDLRLNPLDRDPELKGQALRMLLPYCDVLTDGWDSRSTMADHVSVM